MRLFGYIPIPGPRRLLRSKWMRVPLIVIGVLSILAAIWFGLPMTGVAFLAQAWIRFALIAAILAMIFLTMFLRWNRRRRAAAALEENLVRAPVGDAAALSERMREALDKLRKSGGKTYLYDLPWYVIIGPPGAGKTTALRNAGIEFPGSKGQIDAVEGFGGTRHCDWWFAEDAVLIDTAGRYTTQDSDREADQASWAAFLDLLKKGRPNQPINGVILAFSVEDMMRASPGGIDAQAETVRARLAEIHEVLKIDFPVYVLFTKADLIAGFREYFSSFNQSRRKLVWGATFQTRDRTEATHDRAATEFDALVSRLSDEVIDRMSEEPDGISRIAIFGLPGQMALLRDNVVEFLRRVFEPTRYKTNAILRGFYFTSGTQEGTPIDQVLGVMARNQDEGAFTPAFMSGKGKSYFLHDLLKRVIFPESDWVSTDAGAMRRAALLRSLGLGTIAVASLGAAGLFGWSFWQNTQLLNRAEAQGAAYFGAAQNEIRREVVDETDPTPILAPLQDLRMMTAGYGDDRAPTLWEGMGLGQHRRLNNAAERAYSDALERMLRPRLILHMENEIPRLILDNDTAGVYRALKVYILLGGQQGGAPDDAAIQTFFAEVWRGQFASAGQIVARDQLEAHLAAMLAMDDTRSPAISIDPEIVRRAQEVIVNLPLAEQAYASIKDRAATSGVPDFNLVERLSGQVEQVFRTRDGSALRDVGVPALFTFEGYWGFFLDELTAARQRLEDDQWVLGDAAGRVGYDTQLAGLERDLHRLYQGDFLDSWKAMFARIELAPLSADAPGFDVLAAVASPVASPVLELVEAVDEETRLTRLYDQIEGLDAATLASAGLGANLGNAVMNRIYSRSGMFQRVVIDSLRDGEKVQARVGGVEEDSQRRQVERITEQFADWHILLRGAEGQRPVDALLANFAKLRENRRTAAAAPSPTDEQLLQPILSALTMNNTSLPEPMASFMNQAEGEFRAVAQDATMAQLNQALTSEVTSVCQQTIEPAFPFGGGRHVAPATFGQFFGPGGAMDRYYSTYLQPHVTRTPAGLQPVAGSPIGDRLSAATLRQFERAEAIRTAFFGTGSPEPQVAMFVSHQASSPSVELAILTINGSEVKTRPNDTPAAAVWPGASTGVMLQLFPQEDGRPNAQQFSDGRWAVVDFLRQGGGRASGNVATVTHQIGGRSITYRIEFESTTVPFLMPELSEFSCPTSLE